MRGLRLVPSDLKIDFAGHRYIAFAVSAFIIISSIFLMATRGLNFGIDFTGGTLIEARLENPVNVAELRETLNALGVGEVSIQEFGSPTDALIRLQAQDGGEDADKVAIQKVRTAMDEKYTKVDYRRVEFVGPQVGGDLKKQGLYALLASVIAILAYVWFRFEWQYGVGAIVALIHDVVGTLGLFALTQLPFDLSTVAAVLLVAGYSTNDTVVIFDRIREVMHKYKKMPITDIINRSINETLPRTTLTALTVLLALAALLIFGGEVIRGFVIALIFGVFIGTHSSIFIASPPLIYFPLRPEPEKKS